MKLIEQSIAFAQPQPGIAAYESAWHTRRTGVELIRVRFTEGRDDIFEQWTMSRSLDNGRTWSSPEPLPTMRQTPDGTLRRSFGAGFVDRQNGRLLQVIGQAILRQDCSLDAMTNYLLFYRVSEDGGRTWLFEEQVIQHGSPGQFTPEHPVEGVWQGKNAIFDGTIVVPVHLSTLGPDGTYFCPPGAFTYTATAALRGTWRSDGRLDWELGRAVHLPPDKSTRGAIEPAIADMSDGRLLMVIRGSNDADARIPGHKWHCISQDGGRTWSEPRWWGYRDGSLFYSPSSYSSILKHSNGNHYWFGNICPDNPRGNGPRYPLMVGQVDPESFLLIRESVIVIDTRQEGEDPEPNLSNFNVYEDRETGDLTLRMTRHKAQRTADNRWVYTGDSHLYRIHA